MSNHTKCNRILWLNLDIKQVCGGPPYRISFTFICDNHIVSTWSVKNHTCEVHVQFQNLLSKLPVHQQTCTANLKMPLMQYGAIVHHWCQVLSWTCKVPGSLWCSHQDLHEVSASDIEATYLNWAGKQQGKGKVTFIDQLKAKMAWFIWTNSSKRLPHQALIILDISKTSSKL